MQRILKTLFSEKGSFSAQHKTLCWKWCFAIIMVIIISALSRLTNTQYAEVLKKAWNSTLWCYKERPIFLLIFFLITATAAAAASKAILSSLWDYKKCSIKIVTLIIRNVRFLALNVMKDIVIFAGMDYINQDE